MTFDSMATLVDVSLQTLPAPQRALPSAMQAHPTQRMHWTQLFSEFDVGTHVFVFGFLSPVTGSEGRGMIIEETDSTHGENKNA